MNLPSRFYSANALYLYLGGGGGASSNLGLSASYSDNAATRCS